VRRMLVSASISSEQCIGSARGLFCHAERE
jgi:hypothetical protein